MSSIAQPSYLESRSVVEVTRIRALKRQHLLEQVDDLKKIRPDLNHRKLRHIINTAISEAFCS